MDDEALLRLLVSNLSGIQIAFKILIEKLEREGAIKQGAYLADLKATFNDPSAQFQRGDYEFLRQLALLLEGHHDEPKPTDG